MNLELRQLRYFVTVAEELHFGRAAARLHMTQPPLSQTIMALEELLGAPLFVRTRREVQLTPAGGALLPEARRLLAQALDLPALVRRAAQGEAGRLSLAFVSSADYSVLPPLLRAYQTAYPQVQIALQEATSDLQLDELLAGRMAPKRQIRAGFLVMLGSGLVNLLANVVFTAHASWALWPIAVFAFGWALMVPVVTLLVLDLHPERRGMASSLQMFVSSLANGLVAGVVAPLVMHSTSTSTSRIEFHPANNSERGG